MRELPTRQLTSSSTSYRLTGKAFPEPTLGANVNFLCTSDRKNGGGGGGEGVAAGTMKISLLVK